MRTNRLVLAAFLLQSLFFGLTPAALAASPVTTTHETVSETVTWSLSDAQCPLLQVPLSGSGERHMVITTQVYADGTVKVVINDVVKGAAWDSTGTYLFKYSNHSTDIVPAGSSTHSISMTDSFVLNGDGSAKHFNVGFNWRWTYEPPNIFPPVDNFEEISTVGDPLACDPI